jgi:hypothetical protein
MAFGLAPAGCRNAEADTEVSSIPSGARTETPPPSAPSDPEPKVAELDEPSPEATAAPDPEPTLADAQGAKAVEADELDEAEPAVAEDAEIAQKGDEAEPSDESAAEPKVHKVLILGDSLIATGIGALLEKKLDARSDVTAYRKGKSASGLSRPDFFDWIAEGKRQVALRDPELVVVILGGNDGQDIAARARGEKRVPWKHEDWDSHYRTRMDEFLAEISTEGRTVLWLGLPTMGLRSFEKKLVAIRAIQKDAVDALGDRGIYVDTAPFVSTEDGELLTHAPVGKRGKVKALRADDRIHFTMAGSEYFADKLLPSVLQALGLPDEPDETGAN